MKEKYMNKEQGQNLGNSKKYTCINLATLITALNANGLSTVYKNTRPNYMLLIRKPI